jgi:hypothetical protein
MENTKISKIGKTLHMVQGLGMGGGGGVKDQKKEEQLSPERWHPHSSGPEYPGPGTDLSGTAPWHPVPCNS